MGNGIAGRQNEDKSLAMLAAQRELYNEVAILDLVDAILLVFLPLLFASVSNSIEGVNWASNIVYVLSIVMVFLSKAIEKCICNKRQAAALIQLEFDVYVFNMPWDKKLFGKQKNLNSIIVDKSKRILNNKREKASLENWYVPTCSQMSLERGILLCQKENFNWDVGLRKRFMCFSIIAVVILSMGIFVLGFIFDESFRTVFFRIIFVIPMIKWLYGIITKLNGDIERLNELDRDFCSVGNRITMSDLQLIQKSITDHRKAALKIPNCFYYLFRNNNEDRERRIAQMELDALSGEL